MTRCCRAGNEIGAVSRAPERAATGRSRHCLARVQHGSPRVASVVAGVTAISEGEIGAIHLQATKTLVDIAELRVALLLKKFNGIELKGRKLAIRPASEGAKKRKQTAQA